MNWNTRKPLTRWQRFVRKVWGEPRQPTGLYPSKRVWTVTTEVKDQMDRTFWYHEDLSEDYLRGWIMDSPWWDRAEWAALDLAERIRKTGIRIVESDGRHSHYPVHRVMKVQVRSEPNPEYKEWRP